VLPGLPGAWHRVTLRELLQHRSGLPDYSSSPALARRLQRAPRLTIPPGRLLRYVWRQPLQFPPGSRYKYDNSDNVTVAMMAEAVTGRSCNALLRALVYRRAGLRQTSLPSGFRLPHPYLHGYLLQPGQAAEDVSEALTASAAWASGGMVSTPAETNTFIRAYLAPRFPPGPGRPAALRGGPLGPARPRRERRRPGHLPVPDPVRHRVRAYRNSPATPSSAPPSWAVPIPSPSRRPSS
jgi:D-alanyl-D-alanine carboxypeptidase